MMLTNAIVSASPEVQFVCDTCGSAKTFDEVIFFSGDGTTECMCEECALDF